MEIDQKAAARFIRADYKTVSRNHHLDFIIHPTCCDLASIE